MERTRFHKSIPKEPVPDLPDLMNDWFFGTASRIEQRECNLANESTTTTKEEEKRKEEEEEGRKSVSSSRLTQEWLEEAKRMVADSPSRHGSPSRLVGSPKFAGSHAREPSAFLERRDPLSRSARRNRSSEGISEEILVRSSIRHSRTNSETHLPSSASLQPQNPPASSAIQQWFSNILHPLPTAAAADHRSPDDEPDSPTTTIIPPSPLPPNQHKSRRKSRFQQDPPRPQTNHQPLLSPPRNLVESAHRRSVSSSTCSLDQFPRGDPENAGSHLRRAASVSSVEAGTATVPEDVKQINSFLKRQKAVLGRISDGEGSAKAKIILSGSSTSCSTTSSMVAAICYAWLLENREKKGDEVVVVPVMNMRREKMWKHKQAAWLFHHLGIDASALLFSDEVDLEGLIMARQLSMLVIGHDVLETNGKVGSQCTVLTDNYCEDAYNLLQAPNLKKLLLASILLDTQNLNSATKFFTNRDAEAVQLLLVGSSPSYRHDLYEQLMQDQRSNIFLEALRQNYGKPSIEDKDGNRISQQHRSSTRKPASTSQQDVKVPCSTKQIPTTAAAPAPAPAPAARVRASETASGGKNKSFLSKWFGFGSK